MNDFFNVLLNNTDDVDKLLEQAEAANVDVRLDEKGAIMAHALKKTPEAIKVVNQLTKLAATNKSLVSYAITKRGNPGVFNPTTPGDVARTVLPSSGGGLGAEAGLMGLDAVAPEAGVPLQLLMGALGGWAGADFNKETPASGIETGTIAGGTQGALKGFQMGLKDVRAFVKRPGVLDRRMMANVGQVIKDAIEPYLPSAASKIIADPQEFGQKGKDTVVRILNSPEANDEIGKYYQDTLKTVTGEVVKDAKNDVSKLEQQFVSKYGFPPIKKPPNGAKATKKMLRDIREYKEAVLDAKNIGPEMTKSFDEIAASTRGAYDSNNELKHSYSAIKGVQNKTQLKDKVDDLIKKADPSGQLTQTMEQARDNYSKWSGFQDFVNQTNVMDKKGQFFNAQTLQKAVDGNTNPAVRFIQRRVKEAFEPLVSAVRRGAEPFDEPTKRLGGLLGKTKGGKPVVSDLPLWNEQGGIRAGGAIPGLGRLFTHVPAPRMFGHYIGDSNTKIPQAASKLPVLLNSLVTQGTEMPEKDQQ